MTGKLFKYEMRCLMRKLAPVYIAILIIALISGVVYGGPSFLENQNSAYQGWINILYVITFMAYFGLCVALCVITLLQIINRFSKGLMGREGYLMFTLPVTPTQIITAKTLAATVMTILGGIVGIISVILLGFRVIPYDSLFSDFTRLIAEINASYPTWGLLLIEMIICAILSIIASVVQIYAAIAVGYAKNNHKMMWSVAAYVVMNLGLTAIGLSIMNLVSSIDSLSVFIDELVSNSTIAEHLFVNGLSVISIIEAVIFSVITLYMLKNKLNLE